MKFGVYLYDGVEPIDLATIGVLSMAKRIRADIAFCTIAPQAGPVLLSNGLTVLADHGRLDAPQVDVLILTGGPGWVEQAQSQATLEFLRRRAADTVLASVCTGGMILAASGLLDGHAATTKREVVAPEFPPIQTMRTKYPQIEVREACLVDNGTLITGGGVSLCIDVTLYLLERFVDAQTAAETARIMEYTRARAANLDGFAPIIFNATNEPRNRLS